MNRNFALSAIAAASLASSGAYGALATGDILFLGLNSDEAEHFAFVVVNPISSGEVINFTDASYGDPAATDRLRWTEHLNATPTPGPLTLTTSATIPAGTTIVYDDVDNRFETLAGTAVGSTSGLEMDFGTGGDNIFAYQGNVTFNDITGNYDGVTSGVTFISGILTSRAAWQTAGAGATDNSYLPASLTNGTSANAYGSTLDNLRYNGPVSFLTTAAMRAAIADAGNWTGSDTVVAGPSDFAGNFTVVPEPATLGLLGLASLVGLRRRCR